MFAWKQRREVRIAVVHTVVGQSVFAGVIRVVEKVPRSCRRNCATPAAS